MPKIVQTYSNSFIKSMCVCVVYMCVYVHTCIYVTVYIHVCMCMGMCMHICVQLYVYVCVWYECVCVYRD